MLIRNIYIQDLIYMVGLVGLLLLLLVFVVFLIQPGRAFGANRPVM